jgi:hypothetical protein
MSNLAVSVAEKTRNSVLRSKKRVWTIADFKTNKSAALRELSRLTEEGLLVRPSKGIYVRPVSTVLGPSTISSEELAKVKALKKGAELVSTGYKVFNVLGITTQVSGVSELAVDRPVRVADPIKSRVRFVIRDRRTLKNPKERSILEALRRINHISDATPTDVIAAVKRALKSKDIDFEHIARLAVSSEPPRVRALLGAIGESLRIPARILNALHNSLNPTTIFRINLDGSLPTASAWNIRS